MKRKRAFRKFTYRGTDLDQLLDMPKWVFYFVWCHNLNLVGNVYHEQSTYPESFYLYSDQLVELMHSRARRRFRRGLKRKPLALIKKLRKAKKEAPPNEKPAIVKTHLRNMIVIPEMVGSIVGVYNGKTFNQVRNLFGEEISRFSDFYYDDSMTRLMLPRSPAELFVFFKLQSIRSGRQQIINRHNWIPPCQILFSNSKMFIFFVLILILLLTPKVEVKPEMIGFYLGEFSLSYKPVKHGRPGIGATHSSRFIPLK